MEERGKTSLEKKWMKRISGKLSKGAYWAIATICTDGNSLDTGSNMGHPCKTNFNGFSTRHNKSLGANLASLCSHESQEIIQTEQPDRALFCFSSRGLQG